MAQMQYQLIKAINRNSVFGDKKATLALVMSDTEATHFAYRVVGQCNGTVSGPSRFKRDVKEYDEEGNEIGKHQEASEWCRFVGEFYAINNAGKGFESAQCYLPRNVEEAVKAQFAGGVLTVEFAFDIFVKFDDSVATSYTWLARAVRDEQQTSTARKMADAFPAPVDPTKAIAHDKKGK